MNPSAHPKQSAKGVLSLGSGAHDRQRSGVCALRPAADRSVEKAGALRLAGGVQITRGGEIDGAVVNEYFPLNGIVYNTLFTQEEFPAGGNIGKPPQHQVGFPPEVPIEVAVLEGDKVKAWNYRSKKVHGFYEYF